jgi:hypothetical protein
MTHWRLLAPKTSKTLKVMKELLRSPNYQEGERSWCNILLILENNCFYLRFSIKKNSLVWPSRDSFTLLL